MEQGFKKVIKNSIIYEAAYKYEKKNSPDLVRLDNWITPSP